ncbi:hypothetical protein ABBQ38_000244 [Trebouxia sp. C0009 RCD-2024]
MAEQEQQEHRSRGTVKWFNASKGFGFITPEGGGEDLFVHQTTIEAEGFRSLREGEEVEFVIEPSEDNRFKAVKVTGPDGARPQGAPRRPYIGYPAPPQYMGYGMDMGPYRGRGRGPMPMHPAAAAAAAAAAAGRYPQPPYGYWQQYGYFPPPFPQPFPGRMPIHGGRADGRGFLGERRPPPGTPGVSSGLQVVVHNLPWNTTWQQLKDAFVDTGTIERADVIIDSSGRSRGFGTVRFSTKEEADAAADKLNNTQIGGRTVTVRIDRFA